MGEGEMRNFVYSSLWNLKSSFTCRKILRHGTFRLYFPSERKVCCGFLSSLKIHRLGPVLNPQTLGPVASTLTTTPPRRHIFSFRFSKSIEGTFHNTLAFYFENLLYHRSTPKLKDLFVACPRLIILCSLLPAVCSYWRLRV
jgi:hypothetical protein